MDTDFNMQRYRGSTRNQTNLVAQQVQLWDSSMPRSSGPGLAGERVRETLSRWPLCLLAGPTNIAASPATGWQEEKGQSSYMVSRGSSQHSFLQFHTNCK